MCPFKEGDVMHAMETEHHTGRLNHERFGAGEGELAKATWRLETEERIPFEFWLYSLYEPKETAPEPRHEPSIFVKCVGPGVFWVY
jgi:hypothetical protein